MGWFSERIQCSSIGAFFIGGYWMDGCPWFFYRRLWDGCREWASIWKLFWMYKIILPEVLGWMLGVGRPVTWRINGRGGCEPQVAHGARRLSDSEVPGLHTRTRPRPEPALPGATVAPCTPHLTSTKRLPPRDLHQKSSTKRPPPKYLHQNTSTKRPPPNDPLASQGFKF